MNDVEIAIESFAVIGNKCEDFTNDKFRFHLVPDWQSPSFSPLILLPHETLTDSDLQYVESFFAKHPILNPSLNPAPYFNLIKKRGMYRLREIEALCHKYGWEPDPKLLAVNLIKKPIPLNIPAGFCLKISGIAELNTYIDFKTLLRLNFNADDRYIELVDKLLRRTEFDLLITILYDELNQPIANAAIHIRNKLAFLTWGSVREGYRNKGFIKLIIGVCKAVASSCGVETCVLTTRNDRIRKKSDAYVELLIYRKRW